LATPDPQAIRDALDWERQTWDRAGTIARQCGGAEHVQECEDMGGYVVVEDGPGCSSSVKLFELATFGKPQKVLKLATSGKLGIPDRLEGLVPLLRDSPVAVILATALASRLVILKDVKRDLKKMDLEGPIQFGCRCTCVVNELVEARVTNAEKGDVGLVPLSAPGGEDIVVTIFNAIGQRHRHAVIFLDEDTIRHNTAYDEPDDDDLVDANEIKLGPLNNGTPGIITESVDAALTKGRLAYTGLLLKPSTEFIRPLFEDAADEALAAQGYYKISDYSGLDGMFLPYAAAGTATWETDELKGTMCSGLVHYAFTRVGFVIPETFYSASLRNDVADVLYDTVKDQIGSSLGFFESLASFFLTGTKKKIANQVVNCFAGLGCDDNTDTWKDGVGSAYSVSPDNLLPEAFTLEGTGCAPWGDDEICAGDYVVNPDGASITPFLRVEPMHVRGEHWEETVLEDW
jgi:hypothetical protein